LEFQLLENFLFGTEHKGYPCY